MATFDDCLIEATESQRAEMQRIRGIVHDVLPGVEEVVSYNMPGFKYLNQPLIWVGAFKKHMSIFPGTIKFTPEKPLPTETIKEILSRRVADISGC